MPTTWTTRWRFWSAARLAIRRRCLHRAVRRRGGSATKHRRGTLGSISAWLRPWPTSLSAAGRTASSATCMARDETAWSFIRTRKLWWSAGRRSIHGSFETFQARLDLPCETLCPLWLLFLTTEGTEFHRGSPLREFLARPVALQAGMGSFDFVRTSLREILTPLRMTVVGGWMLLVHTAGKHPAIDLQDVSGDEAG